jgi:hypothetical protein
MLLIKMRISPGDSSIDLFDMFDRLHIFVVSLSSGDSLLLMCDVGHRTEQLQGSKTAIKDATKPNSRAVYVYNFGA